MKNLVALAPVLGAISRPAHTHFQSVRFVTSSVVAKLIFKVKFITILSFHFKLKEDELHSGTDYRVIIRSL